MGQIHPKSGVSTSSPKLERFTLGPFETNCYVVTPGTDTDGKQATPCWIIDASFEPDPLIHHIREQGLRPEALILTHAHVDHIAGVAEVVRAFPGLPVLVHEAEMDWLNDPLLNLSATMGMPVTAPGPTRTLKENDVLTLGGDSWRVLHTPGHSPGGITLVHDASGTAIDGDSLFAGSIGRTDFPGSDHRQLEHSIRNKLYTLPGTTRVFPGHGPSTTIGKEKLSNPYVRA
jgi:hydroxyacylglutathione hydrolase